MNLAELVKAVTEASPSVSRKTVDFVLKNLGTVAANALARGDEVTLPGLGKLSVKQRAARTGRNPATGEEMQIAAKKVPHFGAAKALKDAVA